MVFSVTSSYKRKISKTGSIPSGTLVGVIKKQIKKNFSASGRPRKWKRNTIVTIDYKRSNRLMVKPNFATGEMRNLAIKGRIRTVKRKNKIDIKYIIPTSQSNNPKKFLAAHKTRMIHPFGNQNIPMVKVPARPFMYVSRQAYAKILRMSTYDIEDIIVSMACPPGEGGKEYNARDVENELSRWANLKGN